MGYKIIITGGAGYIGTVLVEKLLSEGHHITIIDDLSTGDFAHLPHHHNLVTIKASILNDLNQIISGHEIVFHLAAIPSYGDTKKQQTATLKQNFQMTKKVASLCQEKNIPLLFPSTTSVYGSRQSKVDEDCKELIPQTPHALSKLMGEQYLQKLGRKGLHYTILRLGTVSGYSQVMRFDTAINKFLWQAATKQPVTAWKTALDQIRPYLFMSDCLNSLNFILSNNLFNNQIYNVLSQNLTVAEIIKQLQTHIPTVNIRLVDSPLMNSLSYQTDDTKIRQLGFAPQETLESSLKETLAKLAGLI